MKKVESLTWACSSTKQLLYDVTKGFTSRVNGFAQGLRYKECYLTKFHCSLLNKINLSVSANRLLKIGTLVALGQHFD